MSTSSPTPPHLIFMMKAPVAGRVKTRLAAEIGTGNAAQLYRKFVEYLCRRLFSDPTHSWATTIAFDPAEAGEEIRAWLAPRVHEAVNFRSQCEGDLGRRLEEQFDHAFNAGAPAVLALGTDCLEIDPAEIQACFHDLEHRDVVLGEALDGGYWCIGMSAPHYALFREMPWSQPDLAGATRRKSRELGLSLAERAKRMDVDRRADLLRLPEALLADAALDPSLWNAECGRKSD